MERERERESDREREGGRRRLKLTASCYSSYNRKCVSGR